MLTTAQFAKKFDLALLAPEAQQATIKEACETAIKYQVASVNVNSYWAEYAASILKGSGVGASAVIGFPFGACISEVKYLELERMVGLGCTACDMVVNIGALKDKRYDYVRQEVQKFVEICGDGCLTKLIFEVGFLTPEEIGTLTEISCEAGIDYVKTATGTQAFPDINDVKAMRDALSGNTAIKVSGVPRTFTLPAVLYLFDKLGVGLVGTRSAGKLVEQYKSYLVAESA
jgi:deoxyribose-phosphate aldolase